MLRFTENNYNEIPRVYRDERSLCEGQSFAFVVSTYFYE